MKLKNTLFLLVVLFGFSVFSSIGQTITPVAEWRFDDSNDLLKASYGTSLVLTGTHTAIAGPTGTDNAIRIGIGSYYRCNHGIAPNKGTKVNTYSILFDFRVSAINRFSTFFQTTLANNDDGDLFIKNTSTAGTIGTQATGYSTTAVTANTWNRLVVVVDNGAEFSLYLNGTKVLNGTVQPVDGRWALDPAGLLLFADNDRDDNEIDVARVSIYSQALTREDVLSLGGIYPPPAAVGEWNFDDTDDLTKAVTGADLTLVGTHTPIAGATEGDGAIRIGTGNYYEIAHGIAPNKGEIVNTYSLLFDFKVADYNGWRCFFQNDPTNAQDGKLFIRNGTGTVGYSNTPGYSTKVVSVNQWNRLVMVMNSGNTFSLYLNGERILNSTGAGLEATYALYPKLFFFRDNNGEDLDLDISRIAIYDKALSSQEVLSLGGYAEHKSAFKTLPYLQNHTANGITIMWESDVRTTGVVNYGLDAPTGNVSGVSSFVATNANTYVHKVRLSGLDEATSYQYKVIVDDSVSETQRFTTANTDASIPFTIGIWGDSHYFNPFTKMASYMTDNLDIDFFFSVGDLSNTGNQRTDLGTVFVPAVINQLASKAPFYVSMGNHDVGSSWGGGDLIRHYIDQPSTYNSDTNNFRGTFAYKYGNTVFISVDWNSMETDVQPNGWVETFLKSSVALQADFKFLFIHCAPFYERWQTAEKAIIKTNVPLLCKKYGINATFSGHMHGYERGLIDGTYFVTCGGGSYLDTGEPVGPTIYSHILVGTNKAGNPANIKNGLINHIMTLEVDNYTTTARLYGFESDGTPVGELENFTMTSANATISGLDRGKTPDTKADLIVLPSGELLVMAESSICLTIFDVQGRAVFRQSDVKNGTTINIDTIGKGAYIARLTGNDVNRSRTFIK